MRTLLTATAAFAAPLMLPAVAAAQQPQLGFVAPEIANGVRIVRDGHGDRRGDRHRGARNGRGVYVGNWAGGEWALYNNRSWDSGSYNDWWHDRPDRSYPRWMTNNVDCQRVWWSGGGWRC
ncbi:hypothetical protein G7078_10555 [Sphingomonas sinipercae]|uniref:Uncharacterized protein n=1 Tax=Sphingomonas sinipercae TaxID=2714944 RepID=A0A6G7ZQF5_9SPHN|nr:hypothetical protein [Sphingomonas sinipercae]QIL03173.1 hypothetical protein G7078_10555 [Sphingomonas sinipercae]